jgi:hypothetical protein
VSMQTELPPNPLEQLKKILEDAPRDYDSFAEYVRELELHRQEEDIFLRLAFRNASAGGVYRGTGPFVVSVSSELYDPLDDERKLDVRRWWHEKVRRESNQFDDLATRLSRIA